MKISVPRTTGVDQSIHDLAVELAEDAAHDGATLQTPKDVDRLAERMQLVFEDWFADMTPPEVSS